MNEWELVEELTEFMAYCGVEKKKKEATVAEKLAGLSLLLLLLLLRFIL